LTPRRPTSLQVALPEHELPVTLHLRWQVEEAPSLMQIPPEQSDDEVQALPLPPLSPPPPQAAAAIARIRTAARDSVLGLSWAEVALE